MLCRIDGDAHAEVASSSVYVIRIFVLVMCVLFIYSRLTDAKLLVEVASSSIHIIRISVMVMCVLFIYSRLTDAKLLVEATRTIVDEATASSCAALLVDSAAASSTETGVDGVAGVATGFFAP